jgi:4-hydroxy-tetrahydrodipicolinate synthase
VSTFQGTYTALITPFKNGEIDYDAYAKLIERQIEGGVEGIVPAGCTGEAATMRPEEQLKLIGFAVECSKGRVQVVAGTGSNNTREAIELTVAAGQHDIQGVLVISPYYNKPTQAGLIKHYSQIADESKAPVMVYNVPGRTGIKIEPETLAEMAKHPNIQSVKEACGSVDQVSEIIARCDLDVLSGDDPLTLPMMSVGAKGVVSVSSNIAPKEVSTLVRCALEGDYVSAKQAHYELLRLHKSMFIETNPIPVKTVMVELGYVANELRMPLETATDKTTVAMRQLIQDFNLS